MALLALRLKDGATSFENVTCLVAVSAALAVTAETTTITSVANPA